MHCHSDREETHIHTRDRIQGIRGGAHITRADVAIVGAGPAGLSAAIQLEKNRISHLLFERTRIGGLLWYANRVDNLLGQRGRTGRDLCLGFIDHASQMNVDVLMKDIDMIRADDLGFTLCSSDQSWDARYLIIATGSVPRKMGLEGVHYSIEDPDRMKGQRILIIGGGDLAFDNALRVRNAGADVMVLFRSRPKANRGLVEEAEDNGINMVKIGLEMVEYNGSKYHVRGYGSFDQAAAFIGRVPDRSLIERLGPLDILFPSFRTSVKGLYLIGDAASVENSQTAYAMSSGLSAAMDIASRMETDADSP